MEAGVTETGLSQAVQIWCWDLPAKRTPLPVSGVINEDVKHVGCASSGLNDLQLVRCRILIGFTDDAFEWLLRLGKNVGRLRSVLRNIRLSSGFLGIIHRLNPPWGCHATPAH